MDAPPTGRIARFLNIATEVSGLAKVGPDPRPRRHRAGRHPLPADRRPLRHRAGGDAGAGDPGRRRRAARPGPGGLQLGGIMINMVRPVELADDQLAAAAAGRLDVHDLARWG